MAAAPAAVASPPTKADEYVLEITVSRSEPDLSATFLRGDATLSGTALRSVTDFGLTISPSQADAAAADDSVPGHTFALHSLVTQQPQVVRLRISPVSMFENHPHRQSKAHLEAEAKGAPLSNPFEGRDAVDGAKRALAPFYVAPPVDECRDPSKRSSDPQKTLHINPRARLNVTCSRTAPGIDGTIVETMSGQGSVRIHDLFARVETGEDVSGLAKSSTAAKPVIRQRVVQIPCYYSGWAHHSAVVAVSNARVLHRNDPNGPFLPLHVCTTLDDLINTDADEETSHAIFYANQQLDDYLQDVEVTLTAAFGSAMNRRKSIVYAPSPFMTKSVARVPVGLNACGYVLSSLCNDVPAAFDVAVVEKIYAFALRTALERKNVVMNGSTNAGADEAMKEIEAFGNLDESVALAQKYAMAKRHHLELGTALSVYQGLIKPYRLDGTPVLLPTGLQMVEAESWLLESNRSCLSADDCDGSATGVMGVLNAAKYVAKTKGFPFLSALHRTIGTFYLNGVSVLGATAGNADAAVDAPTEVAGHAVAIGIPIVDVYEALERGVHSRKYKDTAPEEPIDGSSSDSSSESDSEDDNNPLCEGASVPRPTEPVVKRAKRANTVKAYRAALFGGRVRAALQAYADGTSERKEDSDRDAVGRFLKRLFADETKSGDGEKGDKTGDEGGDENGESDKGWRLPPLAYEGTAPVCARMYEPDEKMRLARLEASKLDKAVNGKIAPSVARTFTLLDASSPRNGGSHGFYAAFTEISFSDTHALFTNEAVRDVGQATTHLILCPLKEEKADPSVPLAAGVTPKEIHRRRYALAPLFNMEAKNARIVSVASSEARQNLLPRRKGPLKLTLAQSANMIASLRVLSALDEFLQKFEFSGATTGGVQVREHNPAEFHQTRSVFSYAALVHNPTCVAAYANAIMTTFDNKDVFGHVNIGEIGNMAQFDNPAHRFAASMLEASINDDGENGGLPAASLTIAPKDGAAPETDEERDKLVKQLLESLIGQFQRIKLNNATKSDAKAGMLVSVVLNVRKSLLNEPTKE